MSWLSKFLGTDEKRTTTTQALDPASQAYVNAMRLQSQGGSNLAIGGPQGGGSWFTGPQQMGIGQQVGAFMSPYMQNVVDPVRAEFDRLRGGAVNSTAQQATLGGAFGGSRHAALTGARLGELDRGQAMQIGNLMNTGYQTALGQAVPYFEQQRQLQQQQQMEPLWRQQQAQQFMNLGMGPTGWNTSSTQPGASPFGQLLGAGMTLYGSGLFGNGQQGGGFGGMGGGQGGGLNVGSQVPPGTPGVYTSGQPAPWQPPAWNPTYKGPWG